ncbi:mechanosensitive ion channel family protein [Psychrobacter aestuarii]|uniref:mechanosensitive ion channel family protein n=1 Tax=Psychrobacter aestuarii TaxID=556327 RepID=UPI001D10CA3D|nr:mechanosensitive ion channel family protein [Psychrobacter aestuarii]
MCWFVLSAVVTLSHAVTHTEADTAGNAEQTEPAPDDFMGYAEQKLEEIKQVSRNPSEVKEEILSPINNNAAQQAGQLQGDTGLTGDFNESYYELKVLNAGLPELAEPPNLSTPLSTLEFFQSAIVQRKFDLAAYALNMNLIDVELQRGQAIELARRLDFLLNKKKLYAFDEMPDRSDGLIEPPIGDTSSVMGVPRRSIKLGYIDYRERRIPIYIERVRVEEQTPIWVFSAQTVENIDNLYEQYHPAQFERYLPDWMEMRIFGIAVWEFVALFLFVGLTMGLGWLFSKSTAKLLNWYVIDESSSTHLQGRRGVADLVDKFTVPLTFTISSSLVFTLVSGGFPYLDAVASSLRPIVWIVLVFSAMWLGVRIINFFANRYRDLQIETLSSEHFDKGRRRRTYVSIFRRVFIFVMILGGIWIGLSEFANIEGLGKTLLTSAGIAGAVIGIAAQPILGNIIAGMQVAITQPVRIGDSVILDGDFSTIEDLRYTYAVLKTWDERRLIVPMRNFSTDVIENWSHTEAHQTCPVFLYVDYGADIGVIRQKFIEVTKNNALWDGETTPEIFVVEVTENTIQMRGAVSAIGPIEAWTLACEVRETMLGYLHREQNAYLPTERFTLTQDNSSAQTPKDIVLPDADK